MYGFSCELLVRLRVYSVIVRYGDGSMVEVTDGFGLWNVGNYREANVAGPRIVHLYNLT